MKILILGGTGYLGRHFIEKLSCSHSDYELLLLIRKTSDISCFGHIHNKINFYLNDDEGIKQLFDENKNTIDCLLNLSCSYEVGNAGASGIARIFQSNLQFPLNILLYAIQENIRNIITMGTSLSIELNTYTFTKNIYDEIGKYLADKLDINFTNIVLENYYGPDEDKNRFIPSTIAKLLSNDDIRLTAGLQRRDFIHIDDVTDAILLIITPVFRNGGGGYTSISLGSGDSPSIREIMLYLKEITHSNSNLLFGSIETRKGEKDCFSDLSYLHSLGFKIKYNWKYGMSKIVENEVRSK